MGCEKTLHLELAGEAIAPALDPQHPRIRGRRPIAALLTPQRSERLTVPTLHRSGAPGVPEIENLPGGIRQPPLGAGR